MGRIIDLVKAYQQTQELPPRQQFAEELAQEIAPKLRLRISMGGKPHFAAVVFQDTLSEIFKNLHLFYSETDGQFLAWCYRIARNKIAEHFRKEGRQIGDSVDPDVLEGLAQAAPQPMSRGERLDYEYAKNLLLKTKPQCYDYLWFRYALECSYVEIAEEFGLPTDDAARMQVNRCLDFAKSLIAE